MIAWMLLACAEAPPPAGTSVDAWPADVVRDPALFASLTAGGREGWVAQHAHRYADAWALGGTVTRRAAESEAAWRADEVRLVGDTADRLYGTWNARPGIGPSPLLAAAATLAAQCTGVGEAAAWKARVPDTQLAAALEDARNWHGDDPLGRRMRLHAAAAKEGPDALIAVAANPIWSENADGFERRFVDPCVATTLRDLWLTRAAAAPVVEGLATDIFTGRGQGLPAFPRPGADVPERAREAVHQLDETLATSRADLLAVADSEGRALLLDLQLIEIFRQQWLLGRGRELLAANRPQESLATLEAAIDPLAEGGPTDPPALWILVAHARIATGRTREALDALEHLRPEHPDLAAVAEMVGDLAVLQGLDRQGDSKEQ